MGKTSRRVKIGFSMFFAGIFLGWLGDTFSINHWLLKITSFALFIFGFIAIIFKKGEHFEGFIRKSPQTKPKKVPPQTNSPTKKRAKLFLVIAIGTFVCIRIFSIGKATMTVIEETRVKETTNISFTTLEGKEKTFVAPKIPDLQKLNDKVGECFYIYKGKVPRGFSEIYLLEENLFELLKPPLWYFKGKEKPKKYFVNLFFTEQLESYWENDTLTIKIRPEEGRFWFWKDVYYVDFIYKWPPCTEEE